MNLTRTIFSISALLWSAISLAQTDITEHDRLPCASAEMNNQVLDNDADARLYWNNLNQLSIEREKTHSTNKSGPILYIIPVVYHVIYNSAGSNISKSAIEASVQNLNEDFQKLNADISQVIPAFAGIAADIQVEFRLAHKDPTGNCTEGITRTFSNLTTTAGENVKSLVKWDVDSYVNIWVVSSLSSGAGGYTYYPGANHSNSGIVIRSAQLANSLTHEFGHYFNLPHLWGSSNTPGVQSNCGIDDGVNDTPNTIGNQSCNTAAVSCNTLDNVQNYLEYSFCERMFTEGQKSRMHTALDFSTRQTLHTNANLIQTGTNDPYGPVTCAPIAEFSYNKEYICEGASVNFTDDSYNATPTAWSWTFTGGTPSTSTSQNPTITYNTAGVYGVTHTPSTSAGNDTETKSSIITVSSLTADYTGALVDGFENATQFGNEWRVENDGGMLWQNTTAAAATGSRSVRVRNFFTSNAGEEDALISPSYDISSLTTKTMTFKQAFAKKTSTDSDKLLVYWSTNCGETWTLRLPLGSGTLATAPDHGNVFVPTASEWVTRTLSLSGVANATNVRFKFEFESGGGNDIYIDDINIGGVSVGIDDLQPAVNEINIYPNPSNANAKIAFDLVQNVENLSVLVKNPMGQLVSYVINNGSFSAGSYTLDIDKQRILAPGLYLIEFRANETLITKKLIIQ